jgi:hypothetical protein
MNKLGLVTGFISLPFLAFLYMPWGESLLQLYLFDSGTNVVGVWGIAPAGTMAIINLPAWWFWTSDMNRIVAGIVFWFFPIIATCLCFGGAKLPSEKGKKIYLAAFFLQLVMIIMLFVDALWLGSLFLDHVYPALEFFSRLGTGFYIFVFNMILVVLAATTYKEA